MARRRAWFRFYAELNDFLPEALRFREIERSFGLPTSVKDMIEALGVPHSEVDLILVDGGPATFSHRVQDGDRISVYPVFESLDIDPEVRLRPRALRDVRFAVDANLGQLARYLRMLGFDATFAGNRGDRELAEGAAREQRIVLTRDVGLLKRNTVTRGYFVRSTVPIEQAAEVVARLQLEHRVEPFSRCMVCNEPLQEVASDEVSRAVPDDVLAGHDHVTTCSVCGRVYWKGSHHRGMAALVDAILSRAGRDSHRTSDHGTIER